jgi:hypothetical protein
VAELDNPLPGASGPRGCPWCSLGIILGLLLLGVPPLRAAEPLRQIATVVHAHSTWSSGDQTLGQLVARARAAGVGAVFLTENHLLRFEYGLPPLRHLLRYRVDYPSLLSQGSAPFLNAVAEANARQDEVVLIPGTEATPHYYWTGNILQGTLTMHDAQKNLLVLGLYRPENYRDLPVVGNPGAGRWGIESLWLVSPMLLVLPGVWLLRVRRRRIVRLQYFQVAEERRLTGSGILCLAIAGVLLANNFPFRRAPVSPYDSAAGLRPHQALIEFATARGGLTVWSLPEARDQQEVTVAGFRASIHTDPYPDDLLHTDRFTAFGGIYEDTTTFTQPGGGWDRLLTDYLGARRKTPAWVIGEAAYHREGQAGKRFGSIQTVLLVTHKDASSLLQAVRDGRMYALQRATEVGLVLEQFQIVRPDRLPAEAGDHLIVPEASRPVVRVAIRSTDGRRLPIEVRLIRSGSIVHSVRGETPLAFRWDEPPLPQGARRYYRLQVRGHGGHEILSNPIFVSTEREGAP